MGASPDRMASFEAAIREWVDAIDGDIVCPIEGQNFVDHWRERDTKALRAWLDSRAAEFVALRMSTYLRHQRSVVRRSASAHDFGEKAARFEDGDVSAFSELDTRYAIDEKNTRRALGDLTKHDLAFPIAYFADKSNQARLEVAFLRAVQKRVPEGKTVRDVLNDTQLRAMRKRAA